MNTVTIITPHSREKDGVIMPNGWKQNNDHPDKTEWEVVSSNEAMERHRAAVGQVAAAVMGFFERKEPYRINHGSTNSTRPARAAGTRAVDVSSLREVLSVDTVRRVALVEPNVSMDRLVESTLRHKLVPPVVMEFPGITAGGGFAGTGGESSSFRHGFFDDTVESVEMVLADGKVVKASRENEYADLFRGAAGAAGTLGVTTLLEVRLIEAKSFVRTRYRRTNSVAEAILAVREEVADPQNDYVDGIIYSKDHGVIITGVLTDEKPVGVQPQTFSGAWDPWFYMHVRDRTRNLEKHLASNEESADFSGKTDDSQASTNGTTKPAVVEDYIPLAEYLFRYDRGGFWVGESGFNYFVVLPFNRLTRWFLDDFMHTRMLYRALHGSGESASFIVQDVALPLETAQDLIEYVSSSEHPVWPLWLCPLRRPQIPTFHPFTILPSSAVTTNGSDEFGSDARPEKSRAAVAQSTTNSSTATRTSEKSSPADRDLMLNIGIWGYGPADPGRFVDKNRELEAKLRELGGMKWLYAHTYYSADEFWRMYGGRGWYDALRRKYRAETLPTIWDKVFVDAGDARKGPTRHWLLKYSPFGGLYGIWKAIQSKEYLLHRDAAWKWKK